MNTTSDTKATTTTTTTEAFCDGCDDLTQVTKYGGLLLCDMCS